MFKKGPQISCWKVAAKIGVSDVAPKYEGGSRLDENYVFRRVLHFLRLLAFKIGVSDVDLKSHVKNGLSKSICFQNDLRT